MMGININDKHQPFTEQILDGLKTIETRNTRSLDPYCGQRVGIVRTGKGKAMLVGYATLSNYVSYYLSNEQFNNGYREHRVGIESKYHISKSKTGIKFGYELLNVERIEPVEIESRGIVARRID